MLGAIVGDIVGSVYEWNNIKTEFMVKRTTAFSQMTLVLTCAVAETIMNGGRDDAMKSMAECIQTRITVLNLTSGL